MKSTELERFIAGLRVIGRFFDSKGEQYLTLVNGATVAVSAEVGPNVKLGAGCFIGPGVTLADGVVIGEFSRINR